MFFNIYLYIKGKCLQQDYMQLRKDSKLDRERKIRNDFSILCSEMSWLKVNPFVSRLFWLKSLLAGTDTE